MAADRARGGKHHTRAAPHAAERPEHCEHDQDSTAQRDNLISAKWRIWGMYFPIRQPTVPLHHNRSLITYKVSIGVCERAESWEKAPLFALYHRFSVRCEAVILTMCIRSLSSIFLQNMV